MKIVPAFAALILLAGCNTNTAPQFEKAPAPLDMGTASTILLRNLQAVESGDVERTKEDLFPREPRVLGACAKVKVANFTGAIPASNLLGGGLDGAPAPEKAHLTGVNIGGITPTGDFYSVSYSGQGNAIFSGQETFIWANGRWWIRCNV